MVKIDRSEITPEHLYLSRRKFIKGAGIALAGGLALAAGCQAPKPTPAQETAPESTEASPTEEIAELEATAAQMSAEQDELGNPVTSFEAINSYNNFYEFSFGKEAVASLAQDFRTDPWSVEVGGLVGNPKTYSMDDLRSFGEEERIYRMRCVEAWSMVIPWLGFPLARVLEEVEPTSEAKFVRFETLYDPERMPGQHNNSLPWPYVEGLRLDEAMHDLTILATGLYGKPLLPQTGAPVRVVVPWKYGFKSIKSIVKIDLVAEMPATTWVTLAPKEYGFYANVNPNVDHPRWSQATERVIGHPGRVKTLLFNGYEEEVSDLYKGMDLTVWY
jgi:sulfoxide reductase catalytic subunit YedY